MGFRGDVRAQSIQIGAILLFAILIISFSTYQAVVVPNQNENVEFDHNQEVQQQLQDVRNSIVSIVGGGTGRSEAVTLGVRYPNRQLARNPGPATGTLRTDGTTNPGHNLSIANATASPTASNEIRDFWNGTSHNYTTGALVYEPTYNEYANGPETVYEHSVLYNRHRESETVVTGQQLIDGKRISLVTLNGSRNVGRSGSVSLDIRPMSSSTNTVSIWNDSHNLTLRLPTRLSEERWEETLADEQYPSGHVMDVSVDPNGLPGEHGLLAVTLNRSVNYSVQMAKVGIGSRAREPGVAYLTDVRGDGASVQEESRTQLIVEARDAMNNPVADVRVNASVEAHAENGTLSPNVTETNSDGRAVFEYEPADISNTKSRTFAVNVSLRAPPGEDFDRDDPKNVTMNVTVQNTDGDGLTTNGGTGGNITLENAVAADGPEAENTIPAGINVTFTNNFSQSMVITDIGITPDNGNIGTLSDDALPNDEIASTEVYVDADASDAYVDSSSISIPTTIDLDTDGGNEHNGNAKLSAGEAATVYLYEFETSAGEINMTGETVNLTVHYQLANGLMGEKTLTVTPSFSGVGGGTGGGSLTSSVTAILWDEGPGNSPDTVYVYWEADAPDGATLTDGTIEVDDGQGTVETTDIAPSGNTDSGSEFISISGNEPYTVTLTVQDSQGNTDESTDTT